MSTDETAHISELVNKLIPDGRRALQDSYRNLAELGDYCEQSYFNAEDANAKKAALDEGKQYAVQSLASVAYQVNAMAARTLELFDLHTSQLSTLESTIHHISQTIDIHKEKVARREIGSLASNKRNTRVHKITLPAKEDRGVRYMRINYSMNALDHIGHGIHIADSEEFPYGKKRSQTANSEQEVPQHAPPLHVNRQRGESMRSMSTNRFPNAGGRLPGGPDMPAAPMAPMAPGMNRSFDQYDLGPPAPPSIPPTYAGRMAQAPEPVQYNANSYDGPPPPAAPSMPGSSTQGSSFTGREPSGSSLAGGGPPAAPPGPPPPAPPGPLPPGPPPPPALAPISSSLSPPTVGGGSLADQLKARSGELSPPTQREPESAPPAPSMNFQDQLAKAVKNPGQARKKAMTSQKSNSGHPAGPPPSTPPPRPPSPPNDPAPPPPPMQADIHQLPAPGVAAPEQGLAVREAGPIDPPWAPREFIDKAVTIYPYEKDRTDELSFEEGELIYVVKKNADDWFEGVKEGGDRGLFPGNYVQTLDT